MTGSHLETTIRTQRENKRELLWHLLQSSFHEGMAQVKVNISSHSFPPLTVLLWSSLRLCRPTAAGSHPHLLRPALHSHHGVYSSTWEREGKGGGTMKGLVVGGGIPIVYLGIWTHLSCYYSPSFFNCTVRNETSRSVWLTTDYSTSSPRLR